MEKKELIEAMAEAIKDGTVESLLAQAKKLAEAKKFPALATVRLGVYKNVDELRGALKVTGNKISDWVSDILGKIKIAKDITAIDLVVASVVDLGFPNGADYQQITGKIQKLGYQLCPAEAAVLLRLALKDQPNGGVLIAAMEPIRDSDGYLVLLRVERVSGDSWLRGGSGGPGAFWAGGVRFFFVRPR